MFPSISPRSHHRYFNGRIRDKIDLRLFPTASWSSWWIFVAPVPWHTFAFRTLLHRASGILNLSRGEREAGSWLVENVHTLSLEGESLLIWKIARRIVRLIPNRELFMLLEIGNMSLLYIPRPPPSNTRGNVILRIRPVPVAILSSFTSLFPPLSWWKSFFHIDIDSILSFIRFG